MAVSGSARRPAVRDRRRIELVDGTLPSQPYHAVAEQGMPRTVIGQVERAARRATGRCLAGLAGTAAVGLIAPDRLIPDDLDHVLRVHAYLHAAEGRLYEQAVIEAAGDLGLPVHLVAPTAVAISAELEGLRATIGPPWQKDHKWAAASALAALAAARRA